MEIFDSIVKFYCSYKNTIDNFSISFFAGLLFYIIFAWIPNYRKKRNLRIFKKMFWAKLEFRVNYMVQEIFFNSKSTDIEQKNAILYKQMSKNRKLRKLFKKYDVDETNFGIFYKELNSPISMQKNFSDLIEQIKKMSTKKSFKIPIIKLLFKKDYLINKNDFSTMISNIKTDSEVNISKGVGQYMKVSEFLTIEKNQILEICDKLFLYSDLLTVKESKLLSEAYNLKFLNKWNGAEPHIYFKFSLNLNSYLDDCYKLFLVSTKLTGHIQKNMNQSKYNKLINTQYEVK